MIAVIDIALIAIFGFFMAYLAGLSILAMIAGRRCPPEASRHRRFAFVVPAHNEELSVQRTVESLSDVDYPREWFEVIVVADNCTDRTADVAREAGATVYVRTDTNERGKGYALRWCFDQLLRLEPAYDAIVVIDADSTASKNFLSVMNGFLEQGAQAIQCSDMVQPQPGAWSSEVTRLGFTLYNHVRPLGRSVIGCSAGVRGNGMCFATEALRSVPWNSYSLNEDLEYGLILLLAGINIEFAPSAKVFAMMPTNARNAESQRTRWERGRFPVIKRYGPRLFGQAVRNMSFRSFDAFVELVTPAFVNLFGIVCLFLAAHVALLGLGVDELGPYGIAWLAVALCGLIHVFVGLFAARADKLLYKAFLHIPRYALWKFALYAKIFRQRSPHEEWVRTTRDHVVGAPDHQ